jgi:hypothetical protein
LSKGASYRQSVTLGSTRTKRDCWGEKVQEKYVNGIVGGFHAYDSFQLCVVARIVVVCAQDVAALVGKGVDGATVNWPLEARETVAKCAAMKTPVGEEHHRLVA